MIKYFFIWCGAYSGFRGLICLYIKQSSAKSLTLEDTIDGRSFMCKRKSIGPKTVPCGTPESTSTRPEDTPSTTTHCLRF